MRPVELLATLTARGVVLRPSAGGIAYEVPRSALTPALKAELLEHKAEVLTLLTQPAERLDAAEAMAILAQVFAVVEAEYIEGALDVLAEDAELHRQFHDTERAIDEATTVTELRSALAAHCAVIRECCARQRARLERAA